MEIIYEMEKHYVIIQNGFIEHVGDSIKKSDDMKYSVFYYIICRILHSFLHVLTKDIKFNCVFVNYEENKTFFIVINIIRI